MKVIYIRTLKVTKNTNTKTNTDINTKPNTVYAIVEIIWLSTKWCESNEIKIIVGSRIKTLLIEILWWECFRAGKGLNYYATQAKNSIFTWM